MVLKLKQFFFFLLFFSLVGVSFAQQKPDFYQKKYLESLLKNALELMILEIQEEKFDEVYQRGTKRTKLVISRENFINQMVRKNFGIAFSEAILEIKLIKFFSLTTANIIAKIQFVNRENAEQKIEKDISFFVYFEKDQDQDQDYAWKFNLLKLVRIPF